MSELEAVFQRLRESPYSSTFTYGRKKIAELMDRELRELAPGARALDVGCGTGYDLNRMRQRGVAVAGVEPDAELRARAREANPGIEIVDGEIERLPFADASFDFVCAIDVLRTLGEPAAGVAELRRVLRPGGKAFVTVAPRFSASAFFGRKRRSSLSSTEARDLFARAGFAAVDVHGVFLGPWQGIGRVSGTVLSKLLRVYEPFDDWLSDRPGLRDLANHLVVVASR